jgi:uncharacterized membrane protein YdfJ with MMPL/SSD domain
MQKKNLAARAGRWSAQHRKRAILGWILFVVLATVIGGAVGQNMLAEEDMGNGQSKAADQAVAAAGFPKEVGEQVLVEARDDNATNRDRTFTVAVGDVVKRLEATPHVKEVESPYAKGNEGQLSRDGSAALVTFKLAGEDDLATDRVGATLAATNAAQEAHPELRIEQFGDASADKALSAAFDKDFKKAEVLSLPITLVILILAFGALVAAGLPLLLGLTAVMGTIGLLGPVSQLVALDEAISSVVLLVGLAVGVDYVMFYLRREMEERDAGKGPEAALEAAAATSGRAVLISGFTVMASMAGMFLAGSPVFTSFAVGTILVVAVAVLGSVTVLPAMLSWLGQKGWTEKGRVPYLGRLRHRRHESRVWGAILDRVLAHPVIAVVLAGGLMVLLALPAFGMHTINPGVAGLPRSLPIMQTYDRIQEKFPGGPLPASVVVQADDVKAPAVQAGIAELQRTAADTKGFGQPITTTVNPRGDLEIVDIPLAGDGTDAKSEAALAKLRDHVIPATIGKVDGVEVNVTGMTAGSKDFNDTMKSHLPIVFAFVLGLAFILLLVTFRSIVIPIKAIVLNLLSVGASYGILTLVFQDGHGESLLDFHSLGGITSWLPLFLFVILFGLSMDYHVFILSRVREAFDSGMSTERAVAHGIKQTAGVVTSAAIVMVAVFSIFATLSAMEFKQMGVGLAVAILIDATIVRAVLLPATMKLLGRWNWYLPRKLDWLPRFDHERSPEPAKA